MIELHDRIGLPVSSFKEEDKVLIAHPSLLVQSLNKVDDVFTVVNTKLSFGDWKAAVNDRTGQGYVMANGEYSLL
jgi:hypothetical protein